MPKTISKMIRMILAADSCIKRFKHLVDPTDKQIEQASIAMQDKEFYLDYLMACNCIGNT